MGRLGVGAVAVVLAVLGLPGATAGAQGIEDVLPPGTQRGTLDVPVDHGGALPGTLTVHYVRLPATGTKRGTIVSVPGGPGARGIPDALLAVGKGAPFAPLREGFDLVFYDPRGTGASSPLLCSTAPKGVFGQPGDSVAETAARTNRCGEDLGRRRAAFTTYQETLDVEALRAALGDERIVITGGSYGAQVAGEYARRFPARTQAVVLDSPSPIEGLDAMNLLPSRAAARVLREVCFPPGCITAPETAMAQLLTRLRRSPLRGTAVTKAGRERSATVRVKDVLGLFAEGDFDPMVRASMPAALVAARRGDAAPLLRMLVRGAEASDAGQEERSAFNEVRLLATACTEGDLPWEPTSEPATRPELLRAWLAANAGRYAPLAPDLATMGLADECAGWPATERPPFPPAAARAPEVPALVLVGREDLRTPVEDARRTAAQFPQGQLVAVPGAGHTALSTDETGCAAKALTAFLTTGTATRCSADAGAEREVPVAPVPPLLSELPAAKRLPATASRAGLAAQLTLLDAAHQLLGTSLAEALDGRVSFGGLRGGRAVVTRQGVRLEDYEYVPGVRISGRLSSRMVGTVRLAGRVAGTLTASRSGALRGRVGGVALRLPAP
ncbi:alpha/beta fold hydrolase [Conexibacter sp. SYSU D00693]|uniref:alpha/beta fold hydrolase n=1 Tax=Conexibacter sp. SYSU D00693 TaxID=2812560 RepID=UPI00196AA40E|nr:alpha/beta fold hydrolase [Conexibacter sp. SYSU D00693]